MKTIIHVNQHKIKSNSKNNTQEPVLTCKTYKSNNYAHEAIICDKNGEEVSFLVQDDNELGNYVVGKTVTVDINNN